MNDLLLHKFSIYISLQIIFNKKDKCIKYHPINKCYWDDEEFQ